LINYFRILGFLKKNKIIIIISEPTSTKPQASCKHENTEVRKMCNGCNVLLGNHGVPEGDRIPPLKSHRKALERYKVVFLASSVMRLPISCVSTAATYHTPAVSTAKG